MEKSNDYIAGFRDGIKTNNKEWIDVVESKIQFYKYNRNSGKDRFAKLVCLEDLKREMID